MPAAKSSAQKADAVLRDVVRLFTQAQRVMTSCCDATSKECEALMLIARIEGLTVQAFAEQMGLEKTWGSRLLVRMEKDGLIERGNGGVELPTTIGDTWELGDLCWDGLVADDEPDEHGVGEIWMEVDANVDLCAWGAL